VGLIILRAGGGGSGVLCGEIPFLGEITATTSINRSVAWQRPGHRLQMRKVPSTWCPPSLSGCLPRFLPVSMLIGATIFFLNWPKIAVPPGTRAQAGALAELRGRRAPRRSG